jgi:hypothetical protein
MCARIAREWDGFPLKVRACGQRGGDGARDVVACFTDGNTESVDDLTDKDIISLRRVVGIGSGPAGNVRCCK